MRNSLLAAVAAVALLGAGMGSAVGQRDDDDRWMTIRNESGLEAVGIYIMPAGITKSGDCCWSRDLLGDVIEKGGEGKRAVEVHVNFDDGSGACEVHIRIATRYPGWEWFFHKIDVCNTNKNKRQIILRGHSPISEDGKKRSVKVENNSDLAIKQIFIIPKGAPCCWSRDLFPIDAKAGDKFNVVNLDDGSKECKFDVRITGVKKERTADATQEGAGRDDAKKRYDWYFYDVNVCNNTSLTLKGRGDGKRRSVAIQNDSTFHAISAYAKSESKSPWSNDLLGLHTIPPQGRLVVDFDDGSGACRFDYRITKGGDGNTKSGDGGGRPWVGMIDVCTAESDQLPKITLDDKPRQITIKNESHLDAFAAHAKPKGKDWARWSRDLLGRAIIPRGKSLRVDLDIDAGTCTFALKVTKRASLAKPWEHEVDACEGPKEITLVGVDEPKRRLVTIKNNSQFDAYRVHRRRERSSWSADLLGDEIIRAGGTLDVDFDDGSGACDFDYRITKKSTSDTPWEGKVNACNGIPLILGMERQ